ncbi:MAG: phenylalanine--tRNA ligase beta subunit-related protein [Nitrolancea sp.]
MRFGYDSALLSRCPELVVGVIWVTGVTNRTDAARVDEHLAAAETLTKERFPTPPDIAKFESIAAWRQIYSRFGVKPNRYPCAAESLIRRVIEAGSLPRISTLVDLCNAASLRYAIPVAPFDLGNAQGDVIVRLATGSETYLAINAESPDAIPEGEVIYGDDSPSVLSRRWNWRQSDKGKISLETTHLLITTEAVHDSARDAVERVLVELCEWIPDILGGTVHSKMLDAENPFSEQLI